MNATTEGVNMNAIGVSLASGFLFGSGMILAAALFKVVLRIGFCG